MSQSSALPLTMESSAIAHAAPLRIVIVGHIDHGKSTLVGRLLYETNALPEGKFEQITASCEKRNMPFEWAFLMDALQAERDQNVTIDTTQIWFNSAKRRYCLIDAPGHREFVKNMVTGAANAEAAVLIVDAAEGVREQTRRHAYLLHLLGIRQVVVVINKMDAVEYAQARYDEVASEVRAYLQGLDIVPTYLLPLSAREGDNINSASAHMPWFEGVSLLDALDGCAALSAAEDLPLRLQVQDIYRFDKRRIVAGRIMSGTLRVGDEVLFSPSNYRVKVRSIEQWPDDGEPLQQAGAGQSVGITLEDQIFVERGDVASHEASAPVLTNRFDASLFWLHQQPLEQGRRYKLKIGTREITAELEEIRQVVDTETLASEPSDRIERNQMAEVRWRLRGLIAADDHAVLAQCGRFVIMHEHYIAGGGIMRLDEVMDQRVKAREVTSKHISAVEFDVTATDRQLMNGHKGGVLWFTGLSGSGKSTLARELQQRLFAHGCQVYVLDGDNIRHGLCSDLGFAPEDRSENIRRVGEVASLFADAGMIVIAAFISPYAEDRKRARTSAPDGFHTVYIEADVDTCESRDVKGLYKKARAGEIENFTGVTAPYEVPDNADLVVNTAELSIDQSVEKLMEYVQRYFIQPATK